MKTGPQFLNPFRFLWDNRDTLLLAILLSIAVWVSAVYANDPNREGVVDPLVSLEVIPQDGSLVLLNQLPETVEIKLRAPESVWQTLTENPEMLTATLDLSGASAGEQNIPVRVSLSISPAQILEVTPSQVEVQLDEYQQRQDFPLGLVESGEVAAGFQRDSATLLIEEVTVSGPASRMALVTQVLGNLNLQDARQNFTANVGLYPANKDGDLISGLDISPKFAEVDVKISQIGQYRDVPVVVETRGEPALGYQRTSTDVDPLIVTLYAENEEDIAQIPGFVNTKPVVLTGKTDSFVIQVGLELPDGVIIAGETGSQTVAVSIGIEPKVKNTSFSVPINVRDLGANLQAVLSPSTVEVFLTGPEPVINTLLTSDVIVFVSLADLGPGTYFGELSWDVLFEQVEVVSINPDRIEVIITEIGGENDPGAIPTPTAAPSTTPSP
ncbi:MAG: hypothetical protein JW757_14270 [Anaerolineales bacterium]|nr:hypothetical protein [Anaerolineales bacterium]